MVITKDTKISEVIRVCPEASEVFSRYGMGCFMCMAASAETVEEGALMHDISVSDLLAELNSICPSQE